MANNFKGFAQLPEWPLLLDMELKELLVQRQAFPHPVLCFYAEVLIAYFKGDKSQLTTLMTDWQNKFAALTSPSERQAMELILLFRIAIRDNNRDLSFWQDQKEFAASPTIAIEFLGELQFLLGLAFGYCESNELARDFYAKSTANLKAIGAHRKSLKAQQNQIASAACVHPEQDFLVEYQHLFNRAKEQGVKEVIGLSAMNMAHSFHCSGAVELALNYINIAIENLNGQTGLAHYYMAFSYRCDILLDLGRTSDASLDLQFLKTSQFPDSKSVLPLLESKMASAFGEDEFERAKVKDLPPEERRNFDFTWSFRMQGNRARLKSDLPNLTESEQRLIDCLVKEPRTKFDLMTELFGDRLDDSVRENRVKNLLSRVRKKLPDLIVRDGTSYRLSKTAAIHAKGASAG